MLTKLFVFPAAYWNLIIGATAILYLSVLFYSYPLYEDKQEFLLFSSTKFQNAGTVLVGLCIPLLLDVSVSLYNQKVCPINGSELIGRVVYIISTCLFGLQLIFQYNIFPNLSYETSVWFMFSIYRVMFVSTMMFFISMTDHLKETNYQTIILTTFGSLILCTNAGTMHTISLVKNSLNILYILLTIAFLIRRNFQIWKCSKSYSHFLYVNVLLVFLTLPFGILLVMHFYTQDMSNIAPLVSIYLYILVSAVLIVLPGWISNYDAMKLKDEVILATKMSYVRYYSHELRNPMNIVEMGIQFCLNNISDNKNNIQTKTIRDTLMEVKVACEDSLTIMNDILYQ